MRVFTFEEFVRYIKIQEYYKQNVRKKKVELDFLDLMLSKTYNKEERDNLALKRNLLDKEILCIRCEIAKIEYALCFYELETSYRH